MSRLSWLSSEEPQHPLFMEHWFPNEWRVGDVSCFKIYAPLPDRKGYLGRLGIGTPLECEARLSTRRRLKKGTWRIVTVVAHPREAHKHLTVTDSVLLKGRYIHLMVNDRPHPTVIRGSEHPVARGNYLAALEASLPAGGSLLAQPLITSTDDATLSHEFQRLTKVYEQAYQASQNHHAFLWQESMAYCSLRRAERPLEAESSALIRKLSETAQLYWPETTPLVPLQPTTVYQDLGITAFLQGRYAEKCQPIVIHPSASLLVEPTALGATVDLNLATDGLGRQEEEDILQALLQAVRFERFGGRILIDLPAQLAKRRNLIHKYFGRKHAGSGKLHPATDDSWTDPGQRLVYEALTPSGLLVLKEQGYDRSVRSIYGHDRQSLTPNPYGIAHEILCELPKKLNKSHRHYTKVTLFIPQACHRLLIHEFSAAWQECCVLCVLPIELEVINDHMQWHFSDS